MPLYTLKLQAINLPGVSLCQSILTAALYFLWEELEFEPAAFWLFHSLCPLMHGQPRLPFSLRSTHCLFSRPNLIKPWTHTECSLGLLQSSGPPPLSSSAFNSVTLNTSSDQQINFHFTTLSWQCSFTHFNAEKLRHLRWEVCVCVWTEL